MFKIFNREILIPTEMLIGAIIIATLFFLAIFSSFLSPYSPTEISEEVLSSPTLKHPFGTDIVGRDVFTRVTYGGRTSLAVALIATLLSLGVGMPFGAMAGYLGGLLDQVLSVVTDTMYAFPIYITAILIAIMLGPEAYNIALSVGIVYIPEFFRLTRSITLSLKEKMFIEAERALGARTSYIIRYHVIPYTLTSVSILASTCLADAILIVSGLGFLGIGIRPPIPEWGTDLQNGHKVLLSGKWWVITFPGLMIFLAVLGFNLFGEGLSRFFKERGGVTFASA